MKEEIVGYEILNTIEKPTLIEIDPHGKYVLETSYSLTPGDIEVIQNAWKKFITDPGQHLFVLHAGLVLKKVE